MPLTPSISLKAVQGTASVERMIIPGAAIVEVLHLHDLLKQIGQLSDEPHYEAGGYAERLNYAIPYVPPLSPEDQLWADALIRQTMG